MKKIRIGIYVLTVLVVVTGCYAMLSENRQTSAGNLVVVLDAGHDDSHTGATGNGLKEENLNLQIALACKNELETYKGVTVYLVRDSGTCPFGGQSMGSSVVCNKKRVEFAKSVGADVYVSLHNNSSTNHSARGAGVYYPTTNYNSYCGTTGSGLAQSILNRLLTTGLKDRGISVRYSEDNTRYPDGSLADYYGVIKNSKLKGIPAIIVEHAFVSNAQDASDYLSTYGKLWSLGVLDAKGIADYYGLQKAELNYDACTVNAYTMDSGTMGIRVNGVTGADSVKLAVWSSEGGQDDLHFYETGSDGNATWTGSVPIVNHATQGQYIVDVYANENVYVGNTTFDIQGPVADSVQIVQADAQQGSFVVEAENVSSGTDIDCVYAQVYSQADPDNVKWLNGTAAGAGVYQIPVSIRSFGYEYGTYQIQTYVRDKNGIVKCIDTQSHTMECPKTQMEVTGVAMSAVYEVKLENVPYGDGITEIQMRVSSIVSGNAAVVSEEAVSKEAVSEEVVSETVTFHASRQQQGIWCGYIYPQEAGESDSYRVQVYGIVDGNREVLLGEQVFDIAIVEQKLTGTVNEDGQTVWNGNGFTLVGSEAGKDSVILVNPWCDYASISKILEQKKGFDRNYIAYEIKKETDSPVQLILDIPESMQGKELRVLKFVTGDIKEPEVLEEKLTEDGQKVCVNVDSDGIYVLTAKENRMRGDADSNQVIDLRDAQLVLRAALGIARLDSEVETYCDVDGSGVIELSDAQQILRYALGIIKVL